jgi:hypothetical protein
VDVALKRGRSRNELTRFRYDVTLRVGSPNAAGGAVSPPPLLWDAAALDLAQVGRMLGLEGSRTFHLTGVPDSRVADDVRAFELLQRSEHETL